MLSFYKYLFPCIIAVFVYNISRYIGKDSGTLSEPLPETISSISETIAETMPEAITETMSNNSGKGESVTGSKLPTYFVSHGGPTFMYKDDDFGNPGAYTCLKKLGKKITQDLKPDYILMVSAHWQSTGSRLIEIAVPPKSAKKGYLAAGSGASQTGDLQENPLVYDFSGFPGYMYKETFRSQNSRFISDQVKENLEKNGFSARLSERGIDHGVWVPSVVMFSNPRMQGKARDCESSEIELDLDIPLVQVSLTAIEGDFDTHYKLGQVLGQFRENHIYSAEKGRYLRGLVICSGMSVHNLRDLGPAIRSGKPMPYAKKFNTAISTAIKKPDFLQAFKDLKSTDPVLLKQAHPTLEHFVPLVVAGGSVQDPQVKELYNDEQLSLGWGVYEFKDGAKE